MILKNSSRLLWRNWTIAVKLSFDSLKIIILLVINQQKKTGSKLQELYVNKFDEEQIWSQMKSNVSWKISFLLTQQYQDNLINSKADNFISSILANMDQVSLLPASKRPQGRKVIQEEEEDEEDYEENAWGGEEEDDDEEEDFEDDEEEEGEEEQEEFEEDYDGAPIDEDGKRLRWGCKK